MTLAVLWVPLWLILLPLAFLLAAVGFAWRTLARWLQAGEMKRLERPEYWDRKEKGE